MPLRDVKYHPMVDRAAKRLGALILSSLLALPAVAQVPPQRPAGLGAPKPPQANTAPSGMQPKAGDAKIEVPPSLDKINAYFNAMRGLQADFVQYAPDGRQFGGILYMLRPGRMRFEYNPPASLEIISDGSWVAIRDKKLKTPPDQYPIGQTPLKFLLQPKIDVAKDSKVVDLKRLGPEIMLTLEDRSTFGGTSIIRVIFDGETYTLREWTVTDPQGHNTRVALTNLNSAALPDKKLFVIEDQKLVEPKN